MGGATQHLACLARPLIHFTHLVQARLGWSRFKCRPGFTHQNHRCDYLLFPCFSLGESTVCSKNIWNSRNLRKMYPYWWISRPSVVEYSSSHKKVRCLQSFTSAVNEQAESKDSKQVPQMDSSLKSNNRTLSLDISFVISFSVIYFRWIECFSNTKFIVDIEPPSCGCRNIDSGCGGADIIQVGHVHVYTVYQCMSCWGFGIQQFLEKFSLCFSQQANNQANNSFRQGGLTVIINGILFNIQ